MFTTHKAMFIYAISPLHMGAGTAIGLIDNPIQREVHTDWPSMAGSGIKGAIRHALAVDSKWNNGLLPAIFGPEPKSGRELYAGAVSFTDAQIVCFPVRSLRRAYVYATCPAALARLKRLIDADWQVPAVEEQEALIANDDLKQGNHLILESLAFNANRQDSVPAIAKTLAARGMPEGFFSDKLKADLVILSDTDFTHFVKSSTLVEPHVCIDDNTGTAKGTGLFYTENLPPETLLVSLMMASRVRDGKTTMDAGTVIKAVSEALDAGKVWQFGGDATTGRGLVMLRVAD
ncbi:MAG: type III-B CRISPR module RAMP protein Cmr4 [Acidobacteria bacterium]|nr:type III-B CRISPR module RAMP protein Cmr4 [Acidobacteriota bacterium]